jgi:hypothetical protein
LAKKYGFYPRNNKKIKEVFMKDMPTMIRFTYFIDFSMAKYITEELLSYLYNKGLISARQALINSTCNTNISLPFIEKFRDMIVTKNDNEENDYIDIYRMKKPTYEQIYNYTVKYPKSRQFIRKSRIRTKSNIEKEYATKLRKMKCVLFNKNEVPGDKSDCDNIYSYCKFLRKN